MTANPRYGYRRISAIITGLGFGSSWRFWKQHAFQLAAQRSRKRCKSDSQPDRPHQAEYPNHVWTYDILFARLADGRPFKTLSILTEFTRECPAILVATSILAKDVISLLTSVIAVYGTPAFIRLDNGSEFTAHSVQAWLESNNIGPAFIPPGQPWKNGFIESFHDSMPLGYKFRDECLQRDWFQSLIEAQTMIETWRVHYNTQRPHGSLGYKTPTAFADLHSAQPDQTLISDGYKN
jgi:putative transposase